MPQRQKTAPVEAFDLPDISEADQEFARLIALGKGTIADAFRQTHDCQGWQNTSIWGQASRHKANPKIQAWINAFRAAGVGAAGYTFEQHVAELQRLKDLSVASGNMGAAVTCEQTIGKAAGLHVDQIRDLTNKLDPADILRDIATTAPELAEHLAAQAGIDITPRSTTRH